MTGIGYYASKYWGVVVGFMIAFYIIDLFIRHFFTVKNGQPVAVPNRRKISLSMAFVLVSLVVILGSGIAVFVQAGEVVSYGIVSILFPRSAVLVAYLFLISLLANLSLLSFLKARIDESAGVADIINAEP